MHLVEEVEQALGNLVRLSHTGGVDGRTPAQASGDAAAAGANTRNGYGPTVPGVSHGAVVSGQQDVDSLLSGLGL
jgi:chemotaxis regulatin CheY-phosphate phosphatase CheZ